MNATTVDYTGEAIDTTLGLGALLRLPKPDRDGHLLTFGSRGDLMAWYGLIVVSHDVADTFQIGGWTFADAYVGERFMRAIRVAWPTEAGAR